MRKVDDDRAWPPVKATEFINLVLIKNNTSWHKTVQNSVDDVVGDKEHTTYHKIFTGLRQLRRKLILLEGRPGSGKTTLMNKFSRDWSKREILMSKLFIFVPLRRLNAEPDRTLATILKVACPALSLHDIRQLVPYIEEGGGEGEIFALDGFDEYVPHYSEPVTPDKWFSMQKRTVIEDNYVIVEDVPHLMLPPDHEHVFELIYGRSLPKALVIVTSRPAACVNIRQYAGRRIEVLGFLSPQIIKYVQHYFKSDPGKCQKLTMHLKSHPNLKHMAYLPLHCAMLAFLYEEDTYLPETETEFYRHFTLSTLLRAIKKKHNEVLQLTSVDQLPRDYKIMFDSVCKLAFDATVASKQIFTLSEVNSLQAQDDSMSTDSTEKISLGLVVIDRYFMRYGLDETYTFLHLTFQEYLAATYIARLSDSDIKSIIMSHSSKRNLSVMWKFLCGMFKFSSAGATEVFKLLMETSRDLMSKIHLCYESQQPLPCTLLVSSLVDCQVELCVSSILDCVAVSYVLGSAECQPDINDFICRCARAAYKHRTRISRG